MANANKPMGLSPVKTLVGGAWTDQVNVYWIPAADTNSYAVGDPVASIQNSDINGVPGVILATAGTGNPIRGVVVGLGTANTGGFQLNPEGGMFNVNNLNQIIRPAGAQATDYYVMVVDDPNVIFEVQEIGTGTFFTQTTSIGLNANLVAGANNGTYSGWQLSNVGAAVTATLQVRILGLVRRNDNAFGQYAKYLVKINNHELSAGTAGI